MKTHPNQHSDATGDPQPGQAFENLYTLLHEPQLESAIEGQSDKQRVLLRALRLRSTDKLAEDLDSLATTTVSSPDGTPINKLTRIIDRLGTEYRSWLIALVVPKIRYPRTAAHLLHACLQLLDDPAHPERQSLEAIVELIVHRTVSRGPGVFEATLKELRQLRPDDPRFEERSQYLRERIATMTRPLVLAHRGTPMGEFPENTLEGFQQALDDGADGFEMDVCVTSDGHIVLWHDATPSWNPISYVRQLGLETGMTYRPVVPKLFSRYRRPIHELTEAEFHKTRGYIRNDRWYLVEVLDDLRRFFFKLLPFSPPPRPPRRVWPGKMPTLEEFGQWANQGEKQRLGRIKRINLDVKIPENPEAVKRFAVEVKRILEQYHLDETVVFTAPNAAMMALLRPALEELNFRAHFTDVKEIIKAFPDPTTIDLTPYQSVGLPRVGIDATDIYTELLAYWRLVHPEKEVGAWTLNTEGILRKVMALSVPWILTDNTPEAVGIQRDIAQEHPGYLSA